MTLPPLLICRDAPRAGLLQGVEVKIGNPRLVLDREWPMLSGSTFSPIRASLVAKRQLHAGCRSIEFHAVNRTRVSRKPERGR
jgi:hypothetical protein